MYIFFLPLLCAIASIGATDEPHQSNWDAIEEPLIRIDLKDDEYKYPDASFFFTLSDRMYHLKHKLSSSMHDLQNLFEKTGEWLLGQDAYIFMGFRRDDMEIGVYGEHEISDKLRITFINGILTTHATMQDNLAILSDAHCGAFIYYILRPTEGWTADIIDAICNRTTFMIGFRSTYAHLLADKWKELIAEMGGIDGGGTIIHYAHSLGGTDTDRARTLLSPKEQCMIRVVTLGSVTFVRNEGFQNVINIVSTNDGVSSVFLEPFGYIRNYFDPNSNVVYQQPCGSKPMWPTDHFFKGDTYKETIYQLGHAVVEEFTTSL